MLVCKQFCSYRPSIWLQFNNNNNTPKGTDGLNVMDGSLGGVRHRTPCNAKNQDI